MALDAFMRVTGEIQGDILGPVTEAGYQDSIRVIATTHEVVFPRDLATGFPTGKHQHRSFVITKEVDKTTPALYYALVNNETLTNVALYFRDSTEEGWQHHYRVNLYEAHIIDIRFEMLNNRYPENVQHKEREHVSFCYKRIEWTWVDGGIVTTDDWQPPTH